MTAVPPLSEFLSDEVVVKQVQDSGQFDQWRQQVLEKLRADGTIAMLQIKARNVVAGSVAVQRACERDTTKKDLFASVKAEVFEQLRNDMERAVHRILLRDPALTLPVQQTVTTIVTSLLQRHRALVTEEEAAQKAAKEAEARRRREAAAAAQKSSTSAGLTSAAALLPSHLRQKSTTAVQPQQPQQQQVAARGGAATRTTSATVGTTRKRSAEDGVDVGEVDDVAGQESNDASQARVSARPAQKRRRAGGEDDETGEAGADVSAPERRPWNAALPQQNIKVSQLVDSGLLFVGQTVQFRARLKTVNVLIGEQKTIEFNGQQFEYVSKFVNIANRSIPPFEFLSQQNGWLKLWALYGSDNTVSVIFNDLRRIYRGETDAKLEDVKARLLRCGMQSQLLAPATTSRDVGGGTSVGASFAGGANSGTGSAVAAGSPIISEGTKRVRRPSAHLAEYAVGDESDY